MRPNFMAVGAYDGIALIYKALEKTKGDAGGDAAVGGDERHELDKPARASIDRSRNARHRAKHLCPKVEKKDGALYNVEFTTIPDVKDPYKAAKH